MEWFLVGPPFRIKSLMTPPAIEGGRHQPDIVLKYIVGPYGKNVLKIYFSETDLVILGPKFDGMVLK